MQINIQRKKESSCRECKNKIITELLNFSKTSQNFETEFKIKEIIN